MSSTATLETFIARVDSNAHTDAIEAFCTVDDTIRESMASPRVGRDSRVAHERGVLARAIRVSPQSGRPLFVAGDNVIVR